MEKLPIDGVTVVVPCLNEADSIARVIEAARAGIAKVGLPGEVIVVDNGSTDGSPALAEAAGARVLHETTRGYGSALRKGFDNASYGVVVMGDADLTYDFTALDDLVKPIIAGQADFVIGNRMNNIRPGAMPPLHRYIGNPILSGALRFMFHDHRVHDAHCGLRAISREAYRGLKCVTTGMEFASEMVVKAIYNKLVITERDIIYHPRVGESKLMSFRDGWRHLRFLMLHSPTTTLIIPGLLFWAMGLILAIPLAFGPITIKARNIDIHFMLMAGLLNIVSLQVMTIGLLAKAYAHLAGLRDDPLIARFYSWFTFEKVASISLALVLAGLVVSGGVIANWVANDFGPLNQARLLFLALIILINGMQVGLAAYLFSIMALPRHIDSLPPQVENTGISDV
jgi:glycosyltransferase involved in cell wall biosynthesis